MKNIAKTISLLVLFSNAVFAQTASLSGYVKDVQGKSVDFVTVVLYEVKDSSIVKGAATETGGKYDMEGLPAGHYYLEASFIGYQTSRTAPFHLADTRLEIPDLVLRESSQSIGEVQVVAKKPLIEVSAEKTVFNVSSSISSVGQNGLELLRKAPGVVVDKDENVSVKGKSGVLILIDGQPTQLSGKDLAQVLKSLRASDIDAIEVISNPSAKYDAAGVGGVVNIRLRKNKKLGLNGDVEAGLMYGITPKGEVSIGLNYRNSMFNAYGSYNFLVGQFENFQNFHRIQLDSFFDSKSVSPDMSYSHNFRGGADIYLNKRHTIGFSTNGNHSSGPWKNRSTTQIGDTATNTVRKVLLATNEIPEAHYNINSNIYYQYKDTSGREFGVSADYGLYRYQGRSFQPNYYLTPDLRDTLATNIFRNNTPTNIDFGTLKADYEQKLWKGKLGFGAKFSYVVTDNTFMFYNVINNSDFLDSLRSNKFTYTENVNAAYLNYNRPFGKKWTAQAGLRMEHTNSVGDLKSIQSRPLNYVERNYVDFFPSAAISYTPGQKHAWSLSYSRRITRPTYQNLNPFENKLDELTYEKGNPFLQPQYTNNIELQHTFKYMLTTSIGYSRTEDAFARILDTVEQVRNFITWKNLASRDQYTITIASPFEINKWWNGYANITAYHQRNRADYGEGKIVNLDITAMSLYAQTTFVLPWDLKLELSGWYSSPSIWEGNFATRDMGSLDIGIQKTILKGQGLIKLSVSDLLYTSRWSGSSQFGGLNMTGNGGWESRMLRINFTYRFGKAQQENRRQTGSEDENSRIKK